MAETDGGDIVIRIRGDASDLEEAITRSQGAISGLESGADDAADVLGDMGSAAKKTKIDLKSMSGEGIGAVAAGLSTVNPQAGALVGLFGQLRMLSGPLAIALGVVTAAFAVYKHEVDKAADAAERAKENIEAFNDAFEEQAVIAGDLRSELRLINGEIDKDGLAHEKRKTRIQAAGDAVVASIDKQIEAQEQLIDSTGRNSRVSVEQQAEMAKLKDELNRLNQERADAVDVTESQIAAAEAIAEVNRETAESEDFLAERTRQRAAAAKEQAAADQEAAEAAKERADAIRDGMAALSEQAAAVNAEVTDGIDEAVANMEQAILEIEAAIVRDQEAIGAGITDSLSAVSSLSSTLSDQMVDDNKKAAKRLHRTSQAAGLANVAISTSVAIMKALAELGPIAGAVASVGIGLTGAAQAAAIAAQPPPSAHIGSGMPGSRDPLAPDERMSGGRRILSTEASGPGGVANSMGTQLLNDVNTGRVQSSGQITAVIGRTHLDQELFRSGRRGTSRYARALRTNPHPKPQGGY